MASGDVDMVKRGTVTLRGGASVSALLTDTALIINGAIYPLVALEIIAQDNGFELMDRTSGKCDRLATNAANDEWLQLIRRTARNLADTSTDSVNVLVDALRTLPSSTAFTTTSGAGVPSALLTLKNPMGSIREESSVNPALFPPPPPIPASFLMTQQGHHSRRPSGQSIKSLRSMASIGPAYAGAACSIHCPAVVAVRVVGNESRVDDITGTKVRVFVVRAALDGVTSRSEPRVVYIFRRLNEFRELHARLTDSFGDSPEGATNENVNTSKSSSSFWNLVQSSFEKLTRLSVGSSKEAVNEGPEEQRGVVAFPSGVTEKRGRGLVRKQKYYNRAQDKLNAWLQGLTPEQVASAEMSEFCALAPGDCILALRSQTLQKLEQTCSDAESLCIVRFRAECTRVYEEARSTPGSVALSRRSSSRVPTLHSRRTSAASLATAGAGKSAANFSSLYNFGSTIISTDSVARNDADSKIRYRRSLLVETHESKTDPARGSQISLSSKPQASPSIPIAQCDDIQLELVDVQADHRKRPVFRVRVGEARGQRRAWVIMRTMEDIAGLDRGLRAFHAETSVKAKRLPRLDLSDRSGGHDLKAQMLTFLKALEELPAHYRWAAVVKTFLAPRLDDEMAAVSVNEMQ